ncbi:MAG TPA: serine/threonine-protein kinase, partial [Verrucomicrobiota bacterium]|nr:serine/threonine-protein kinase [Verrucomicrobiota bacterium]
MNGPFCKECGRPLRPNAPRGLCPACLLGTGLIAMRQPSEPATLPAPEPAPPRVGDYELLEEIGRGGMGVVYKARQISLDRIVALKLILGGRLAGRDQAHRFRAEAQAAANLQHPNIVAIHEVGEHAGQLFYAMDYIEGKNLASVISDLRFEISNHTRSVSWMKTVAAAVHYAHEQGILHRDLKPANIIIDQHDQPRITDFGLAKRIEVLPSGGQIGGGPGISPSSGGEPAEAGTTTAATSDLGVVAEVNAQRSTSNSPLSTLDSQITLSGQVLGSPSYLSPEMAEGKRAAVGVASDVYSLGAVLYHLLTGRPPFQGETLTALLRQVIETDPVAPRRLNPSIPRDLETICLKCLDKEPRRRYSTALEVADELGRFLADEPIRARPASRAERLWRWCRRNPKLAGALGAVVLSLVLGLVTTTWQMRRAQKSEMATLQHAYVSDMDLATRALAEGDIGRVRDLLDRYAPPI